MITSIDVVRSFFAACANGKVEMQAAFRASFTPTGLWENVGMMTTVGPEEHIALMDHFERTLGVTTFRNELVNVAVAGNCVLTERIDNLLDANGIVKTRLRLMGAFEIEDGRIAAWRDYFDTTPFAAAV